MPSSLNIGGVELAHPFVLAPLAGISNWPFRRVAKLYGAALTVTEMVSAVALSYRGRATVKLLQTDPELERPFVVQLFGKDPERLALGARVAREMGADLIDLNMGCPARKVVRSGSGAALLKDFALIRQIVRQTVRAVDIPVMVKTRPGFTRGGPSIFELWPILVEEGAAAITLHPRYADELFSGQADWDLVGRLAELCPKPVIGSGDLTTPEAAVQKLRDYKPAAVMIGRGAKGRPWLFRECLELWRGRTPRPVAARERFQTAASHARDLGRLLGPKAPFLLRSVLMWYTKGLNGVAEFRRQLCQETNLEKQIALLAELFGLGPESGQNFETGEL